jgi:hypothetical protein
MHDPIGGQGPSTLPSHWMDRGATFPQEDQPKHSNTSPSQQVLVLWQTGQVCVLPSHEIQVAPDEQLPLPLVQDRK